MILMMIKIILYPILIGPALLWYMVLCQPEARQKGEYVQYLYTTPMIVSGTIMVTCYVIYYFLIKTGLMQRRMFIAYLRFFTGTRDMDDVRESWHFIIYLVTGTVLAMPYNMFFQWSKQSTDALYVHEHMLRSISKPYLKKNYRAFWKFLDQWEELEFMDDLELKLRLEEYEDLDPDDEDFFDLINSHNLYHNLLLMQNHLFTIPFLRHYLRGAVYATFSNPELIKDASELDELTDLFIEKKLFSYAPFSAWWFPASANAARDVHNPWFSWGQELLLRNEVPWSLWLLAANKVDLPFPDYSWNPQYDGEDPELVEEWLVLEEWLNSHHELPYFTTMYSRHLMQDAWLPLTFDWQDADIMRSRHLQLALIKQLYKNEYIFKNKRRLGFRYLEWICHPVGVAWADKFFSDWEWDDEIETAYEDELRYYKPDEILIYYKTIMRSDLDDIWFFRFPKWQREYYADEYGENTTPIDLLHRVRWNYFFMFRKQQDWWWWDNWRRFDWSANDITTWWVRRARFEDLFTLYFLENTMLTLGTEPFFFTSDAMPPHAWLNRNWLFYYLRTREELEFMNTREVYETWGVMTDSTDALNFMEFKEQGVPMSDGGSVWAMDTYYGVSFFDYPGRYQFGFQDSASPTMEGIIDLHHDLMFFLTIIIIFVVWLLGSTIHSFYFYDEYKREVKTLAIVPSRRSHQAFLETVWTIIPTVILLLIAIPSFALIYSMEEIIQPRMTVKIIGHQWYWTYEYTGAQPQSPKARRISGPSAPGVLMKTFDSNMLLDGDLLTGQLRLLEVNKRVYLPTNTNIRLLVTSADVLHSWAVPSLGIKLDACPGRLNQAPVFVKREGVFYGQCSEICGVNHAFMPIVIRSVNPELFIKWFSAYGTAIPQDLLESEYPVDHGYKPHSDQWILTWLLFMDLREQANLQSISHGIVIDDEIERLKHRQALEEVRQLYDSLRDARREAGQNEKE